MSDLRSQVVKLAAAFPKGSAERKALVATLAASSKKASDVTYFRYIRESQDAFVSNTLGHATAILRAAGATRIKGGKNFLDFALLGTMGRLILSFPFRTWESVKGNINFGASDAEEVIDVMSMDPKGVALWVLYLRGKDGKQVLPI